MRKKKKDLRNRAVTINLSQKEFDELKALQQDSTCPNLSLYVRKRIYSMKIVATYRNRSQDDILEEISRVRRAVESLSAPGFESDNGNDYPDIASRQRHLSTQVHELNSLVRKLLEVWLH